jgi:hypothetical protein
MATEQIECPQCGEEAVNTPPTDPVPWAAHGMNQPQWSHTDGSSLCPVLGGSGGYAPAQPQPKTAAHQPAPDVFRLDPPERLRPEGWARPQQGAWATQAVLDAIHSGQLRAELLEDCGFWAAKAAQQQTEAEAGMDPGPTERQLEDWNTHNDHVDGLSADYDLDREA